MDTSVFNDQLLAFLKTSPTPFHAVSNLTETFVRNGFTQLRETDSWDLKPGKYLVTRNGSSIIAFILGNRPLTETGIRMVGAHTDSPCLRVKPNPERRLHGYLNLGVEVYGGVLLNPWFDRDLSLAGRVSFVNGKGELVNRLVNFERAMAIVPSLAIHLDREANNERKVNPQNDILPLIMQTETETSFNDILSSQLAIQYPKESVERIHAFELSFFDTQAPALIGLNEEFIASARLDNLLSCFTGMTALLEADEQITSLLVCNDHEEVGSVSAEGAQGPFLSAVLDRLKTDDESHHRTIARSLMISADNAHGIHPNYADRHDPNHGPILNKGPVIKVNTNQRYATNSRTGGYFSQLCDSQDVPCQTFVVRTDMACGSTIGPITAKEIGVRTIDVGVPTFGMHSIRELAGSEDASHLCKALVQFYRDPALPADVDD